MNCDACCKEIETSAVTPGGAWYLRNYHGISGTFCPKCYSDVSHDSYGRPNHPRKFEKIRKMLEGRVQTYVVS